MSKKIQILFVFLLPYITIYGQFSIGGNDYKKELLKSVAPEKPMRLQRPKINKKMSITDNQILKTYDNYKYKSSDRLMDMFKNDYKVSPNLTTYKGSVPLNKLPAGSTETVFMGGHFVQISNAGKLIVPSGHSLTGGWKKKLSPKTKSILINVFGMDIEE